MGRISDLVSFIKRNVETVKNLVERYGVDDLINDYVLLNAVLHMLQTSIQALIDIGSIILSQYPYKPPSTYSEIPSLLSEVDALSSGEADVFRRMIGFRNVVVHQYSEVSQDLLRKILEHSLYTDMLRIALRLYEFSLSRGIDC
ncbi:MAG: DUF86 domain-containing protein [Vulcanisaeta sp.]|nr:DUF86 domain-containing protein [Vulcanisaeta sp.]